MLKNDACHEKKAKILLDAEWNFNNADKNLEINEIDGLVVVFETKKLIVRSKLEITKKEVIVEYNTRGRDFHSNRERK